MPKRINRVFICILYANNNDADLPAYMHSLISTFEICYLESIMVVLGTDQ